MNDEGVVRLQNVILHGVRFRDLDLDDIYAARLFELPQAGLELDWEYKGPGE